MKKAILTLAAGAAVAGASPSAYAVCDGCVVGAVQTANATISGAIITMNSAIATLLRAIDSDISAVGTKISNAIVQSSNAQREMALEVHRQSELDRANRETELPIDPCATSTSNYAMQANRGSNSTSSSYRPGGAATVTSGPLGKALNGPPPSVEASRRVTAAVHQQKYCTALEVQQGIPGCAASTMPDGDANVDSIFWGAGMPGKNPDLTFTKDQEEAGRAYVRMTLDPNPPEFISKSEAGTEAGKLYIAMSKAYSANMTSSAKALNDELASRMPFSGSAQYVSDIKQSDIAAKYFDQAASALAKSQGVMSEAEMTDFEVGRRFRNPYWFVAFGAEADPTKIAREQLFATAFMIELQYKNLQKEQHSNVLLAQILATLQRTAERPSIEAQLQRVRAINAR